MYMVNFLQTDLFIMGITAGRLWSIAAGVLGLISVVIGWIALVRSSRGRNSAKSMSIISLVLALTGIILSAYHLARTTGGFGTGKGRAGAIVAILIGVVGACLAGLASKKKKHILKGRV